MINNVTRTAVFLTTACVAFSAPASAQMQPTPLRAELLRGGVYIVKGGSGANTGFIIGKKDVVVIDAKMTEEACQAMLAEIRKLTPNPVKYVVLTHSDGDHVNGLAGVPKGVTIVAHPETKKYMEEAFKSPKLSALASYLPNELVAGERTLDFDGPRVKLVYFGPAHTSGDLVVHIPEQKMAFIGDLAFIGRDPLIHHPKGGTSFGAVQVLKKILALDADTFISGHNDPLTKDDLKGLASSIEEKQAKVKTLVQEGKSLEDIKKAFGLADAPGQPARRSPSLVERIYAELTDKK